MFLSVRQDFNNSGQLSLRKQLYPSLVIIAGLTVEIQCSGCKVIQQECVIGRLVGSGDADEPAFLGRSRRHWHPIQMNRGGVFFVFFSHRAKVSLNEAFGEESSKNGHRSLGKSGLGWEEVLIKFFGSDTSLVMWNDTGPKIHPICFI